VSQALIATLVVAFGITILLVIAIPIELTDGPGVLLTVLLAGVIVLVLIPPLIRKMKAGGMVGFDVNKPAKIEVAELGGIAALFAFSISLSVVVGLQKILGNVAEPPFLAAISVFFMASVIGLIDDISDLRQRLKAVAVAFAALPLLLVHLGPEVIHLPFGQQISFTGSAYLFYWLILVPIGITGIANAMNMSAGYNGLESGEIAVVSMSLLAIGLVRGISDFALLIFASLLGCSLGLYYFNRYPAKVFIGDIGTLGLGAALGAGVILGHLEFYGLIAIAPAFYEAAATGYYGLLKENGNRKAACRSPVINAEGILQAPSGAARYTLAYLILSRRPMSEPALVRVLLALYAVCGIAAVVLSVM
jgi:UDP-N-acetylglucosamine--dolichyl-phosphate N-acetylglucosaminephosphotransferase